MRHPSYFRQHPARSLIAAALVLACLAGAASTAAGQSPAGEMKRGGRGTQGPGWGGGPEGADPFNGARIMLHLKARTTKNACTTWGMVAAPNAVVNARDVRAGGTGLYPELFFAYVLVTGVDAAEGVAGAQFGISYDGAPGSGVDIWGWTLCATLQFQQPSPPWPASGGGTMITWDSTTKCQRTEPGGAGTGVVAVAGYFYCTAYSSDVLRITPRPVDGLAKVSTCDVRVLDVAPGGDLRRLGSAGFGSANGYNPASPDSVPPAAVADLAVTGTTDSTATLSWTAPGDDNNTGTATQYDLRYSTSPIDAGNFDAAIQATGEPVPAVAGTPQQMTLSGLTPESVYYFALKTADDRGNWSGLSNVPSGVTPPAPVGDLVVTGTTDSTASLSWTVPGVAAVFSSSNPAEVFSSVANPAGPWSYGWSTTLTGPLNLYTLHGTWPACPQVSQWYEPIAADPAPHLSHDSGGSGSCGGINVSPAQIILHPGPGGECSILRWTAAAAGQYIVRATFTGLDLGGTSTDVHVFHNAASLFSGYVSGTGIATAFVSDTLALAAGDFVDFRVGFGGNSYLDDSTGLDALITGVGVSGAVALYDMRYSTAPITAGNFTSATPASGVPAPGPPGTVQTMTVGGLARGTLYYFAMKSAVSAPNWSAMSNVASGATTADVTPPAAVVDLHSTAVTTSSVSLAWTAPGDDGTTGTAASYDLRYATSPIDASSFTLATQVTGEPAPAAAGTPQTMTVDVPGSGTTYFFALKTADEVPNVSALSNVASATTPTPPAFQDAGASLINVSYSAAAWGDYDNDGDLDLVVANRIYRNNGGVFTDIAAGLASASDPSVAWADYDGDGDLDLLITGTGTNGTRLYRNNGGVFVDAAVGLPGVSFGATAWGDYDNDGDLDLLLAGATLGQGVISRLYRNDSGTFVDTGLALPGAVDGAVAWGDFDNDGDLDFVLAGPSSRIYRNDGNGAFTDIGAGLPADDGGSVAWGDYDGDGDLDLLMTGWTGIGGSPYYSRVYRNNGGAFADIGAGLTGVTYASARWGDFDNDGDLDILLSGLSGSGPTTRLYRNDAGSFTEVNSGMINVNGSALAFGDFDNDGDLDVILTGYDGSQSRTIVYRNLAAGPNTPPNAPSGAALQFSATRATFGWNPASDSATPSAGLTYNLRVGTTPGGTQVLPAMAGSGGYRRLPALGNVDHDRSWSLGIPSLLGRSHLYWSVQSIDNNFAGSSFSPEQVFHLGATITAVRDIPGDQGGWVRLTLSRSSFDLAGENVFPISGYNVWRRVDSPQRVAAIRAQSVALVPGGSGQVGDSLASTGLVAGLPVFRWRDRCFVSGEELGTGSASLPPGTWELVGSFFAAQQPQYVAAYPTVADSTASGPAWTVFMVTAHTTTPSVWFPSTPDSGCSVDNIAPGVPTGLRRQATATENRLSWQPAPEPDFQYFAVYRGTAAGFVPAPGNLVHQTADAAWTDIITAPGLYFYKVTAVDHAGNESPPESEESVSGIPPGVGERIFRLYPNRPNPFAPDTRILFDLPEAAGRVRVEIYDVHGRLVRTIADESMPAGPHELHWDGLESTGAKARAGVYFCRLRAGSREQTLKMMKVSG